MEPTAKITASSCAVYTTLTPSNPNADTSADTAGEKTPLYRSGVTAENEGSAAAQTLTRLKRRRSATIVIVLVIVEVLLVTRGGFLVARYAKPGSICDLNNTNLTTKKLDSTYKRVVTCFYYATLSIIRCFEYLVLGISLLNYFQSITKQTGYSWKDFCRIVTKSMIYTGPGLVLGVATIGLGIQMELYYTNGNTKCYKHWTGTWIYLTYCGLNLIRYLLAYSVRVMMLTTTFMIQNEWAKVFPPDCALNDTSPRYLGDKNAWDAAKEVYNTMLSEYIARGSNVQKISSIFEPWFLIPWVAFSIVTTIDTNEVLLPWWQGTTRSSSDWSKAYFWVYHITQLYLLLFQYVCGLKINAYHDNFYHDTRHKQLEAYDDADYKAYAAQLRVDYEERNKFSPRILGVSLKVGMDNPLYVFLLLVSIFLQTSNALNK